MTRNRICIIGSGATAIYTLKQLLASTKALDITIFESSSEVGKGMPYRADMNAEYMLCNAFSREIPKVTRSLIEWLEALPRRELGEWELSRHELSARAFYPRVLIGEFLADEFAMLVEKFQRNGHEISIRSPELVVDIVVMPTGDVSIKTDKSQHDMCFNHVVIATGHAWPTRPKIGDAELLSPWPYTNVTALAPGHIGILGSSLSAIDIVVALGSTHGQFDDQSGSVSWQPNSGVSNLKITMISKMGIMPEGDFYYPYPYTPLDILSPKAVDAEVAKGSDMLLQRLFELLCKELEDADPQFWAALDPASRTIVGFSEAYFKRRQEPGGQAAIKMDFAKARQSVEQRRTIGSRYVLLRGHENFDRALRALNDDDWELFSETLLPVFADSYAAVPHLSLARVIAMFDAGILSLKASDENAVFSNRDGGGVRIKTSEETMAFDVMIDARGQASAPLENLPFPSLTGNLLDPKRPLLSPFKLALAGPELTSIYCISLPQILVKHPFSQGLANCAENGKVVATEILQRL